MPDWLIFGGDVEGRRKDIVFSASDPGVALPVVHFTMDPSVMPSRTYMFTVRN
jgi:hypothetical protein